VQFELGSAVEMPFPDAAFDGATQLHVGMNISAKETLFAEVYRVLRPGGRFAVYDILRAADGEIAFPVPWATDETTSFVEDLPTYRLALEAAGFEVAPERDRREYAVEFFARLRQRPAPRNDPPPLGLHIIMGRDAPQKIANMIDAVNAGVLSPIELFARKPVA
jgi:SAM-dependent methyltransferase